MHADISKTNLEKNLEKVYYASTVSHYKPKKWQNRLQFRGAFRTTDLEACLQTSTRS